MPGSRLTHEDRSRIAAWLADGLGYAEIGRRLGRPTSTISREVARNAAPGAYRADHAQQAAGHRPRRRRPPRPEAATEVAHDFADHFATRLTATGLPRTTARVFAAVLTADAAGLTAADLVRRLRLSPASVSKSIVHLETMSLLARTPDPAKRRDRYIIDDEVWRHAWQTDTGTHAAVAAAARQGAALLGPDTTPGARLTRMAHFFGRLSDQMSSGPADPILADALTVVAALVHAAAPVDAGRLSAALGWSRARLSEALEALRRYPAAADPLAVRTVAPETFRIAVRPDRLTPAQRDALDARGLDGQAPQPPAASPAAAP